MGMASRAMTAGDIIGGWTIRSIKPHGQWPDVIEWVFENGRRWFSVYQPGHRAWTADHVAAFIADEEWRIQEETRALEYARMC